MYAQPPAVDPDPDPDVPDPDPGPDVPDGMGHARLREEIAQLKQAMRSRPVIDQARGVLMALNGCSAEEAWRTISTVSQHANVKLRVVAHHVVAAAQGTPLPPELRRHLADVLGPAPRTRRPPRD
ncbi:ANTAR domain-containing protein [Streptomyces sp. HPF1205]|uniref:ANTAR domain-containing protein n=1 Tax=Streptomyces sp. HPF1205 TaxID=2873262 RepID=UPI001CEC0484|nr:ANTAR domain-containing protein [Streptomyces sp. HPF1205]